MNESSLFLVKNSFGAKMKSGFRNFCNGESSTSTLDHHRRKLDHSHSTTTCTAAPPPQPQPPLTTEKRAHHQPTLEEMILQLEMEEKLTARKRNTHDHLHHHRMSCVNSSDILRSARNALNQYPRFSLDGKDSMYRSSFTNLSPIQSDGHQKQVQCTHKRLPDVVGGESVIWCRPGVVGRLMGLEAMPIPLNRGYRRERLSAILKRQNLRKRAQIEANIGARRSCSRTGYCVMKPLDMEICNIGEGGWPMRRRFM